MSNRSQISFEYLIVMGFITLVITGILTVAFFYSYSVRDKLKDTQLSNCAGKIVSTAESVFYAGKPSKSTINCYLPEDVSNITIEDDNIIVTMSTGSGTTIQSFQSNVPLLSKNLTSRGGIKKIEIEAMDAEVNITST
jgi:uncharacterized protein (UPF0333 family)